MQVFVTARGTSYHRTRDCTSITGAHKSAMSRGVNAHPPMQMSLEEATARKPEIRECMACAHLEGIPDAPTRSGLQYNLVGLDAVEVRYTIGFGAAATTAKGFLLIPLDLWEAILPEDRHERVLEMIREQAAKELRIEYGVVK